MSRETQPVDVPFRTTIALLTQAHNFLRLALNSDDRVIQEKHLSAARKVLAEMEVALEKARVEKLAKANASPDLKREIDSESDFESEDEDEENESDNGESDDESQEDQQWGEEEDKPSSGEEEWDINNGENNTTPQIPKDAFLTHYFTNGPGKEKPDLTSEKYPTTGKGVNIPTQQNFAVNNLDVRVYARMMELFEIESRYRLSACNAEQGTREKAARESLSGLKVSKQVSQIQRTMLKD